MGITSPDHHVAPSADPLGDAPLAGSYGRRSNPNEEAVASQHAMNAQRATSDGWHIPELPAFRFGDDAVSGEKTTRAGLDPLVAVVESGQAPFRRLYVRERGRLARAFDPRFIYWFEYVCKLNGIQVCYSVDQEHVDYSDAFDHSKVVASFVTSAVENVNTHNELRSIRARTRYGTRTHVTKGFYVGARAPYGTERWLVHKATGAFLERVPDFGTIRRAGCGYGLRWSDAKVPAVRHVFAGIEGGASLRDVAAQLTAAGMMPPGKRPWSAQAVWMIARNPVYKGDVHFGRTKHDAPPVDAADANLMGTGAIYVRNFLASPPISAAQWDVVQRILDGEQESARKRRASRPEYLLTGLLVCAGCGSRLHGHTNPRSRGSVRMYRHEPARRTDAPDCESANRYLRAEPLEEGALGVVERCLDDEVLARLAREELERKAEELASPSRTREIAAEQKNIARLERAAAAGSRRELEAETDAEREVYAATVREVSAELTAARARLAALETADATLAAATDRLPKVAERVLELRAVLAENTPAERKRVVAALIEAIRVDFSSGRIDIRVRTAV